jgi:hypothetical protein
MEGDRSDGLSKQGDPVGISYPTPRVASVSLDTVQ